MSPACWAALTVSAESVPISAAAAWLRSASLRTSLATTAKPRPCSPARAASTAALRASRSVWRAISCTMVIFWAMVCMASTARPTATPLASASWADCRAIVSVWLAFSAFCFTLAAISSIDAEASSVEAACSVEPCDSCSADADSSWDPADTLLAAALASATTARSFVSMVCRARPIVSLSESGLASTVRSPRAMALASAAVAFRFSVMRPMAPTRSPSSSFEVTLAVWLRSPMATASARVTARPSPREIERASQVAMPRPRRRAAAATVSRMV
ncbi:hypothetical protein AU375_05895 [Methylobacterium radiotolerans]|nr:hypothetical protein AU375_05895 [Methylobacterium radiotolerans]